MVHTRINARNTNPNPYINFITALPSYRHTRETVEDPEATELLRALAAQLKPVMKAHGLTVNSFEEYESNKVFLGRNWNNGETVELVLRDGSGQFYSTSMLLSVFCHELAHIKHMNHSTAFHTLRRQLSAEVAALQRKGYYGDGYWSAGTRLADSQRVLGDAQSVQDLPEYTCGGAHTQSRSAALPSRRRRRRVRVRGPSLSTGAQTAKRRKAGSRVISKTAFEDAGVGRVLDDCVEKGGKGSGFGKQAGSRRAREERALAAERRLLQMQGKPPPEPDREQALDEGSADSESEGEDEGFDERCAQETDAERLKMMRDLMGGEDLGVLRDEYEDDVVLVSDISGTFADSSEMRFGKGKDDERQVASSSSASVGPAGSSFPPIQELHELAQEYRPHANVDERRRDAPRAKRKPGSEEPIEHDRKAEWLTGKKRRLASDDITAKKVPGSAIQSSGSGPGLGDIVEAEMRQRRREALGMDRRRRLGDIGDAPQTVSHLVSSGVRMTPGDAAQATSGDVTQSTCANANHNAPEVAHEWTCQRCTFANVADSTTCVMCDGMKVWTCLVCTFENSGGSTCKICDKPCV